MISDDLYCPNCNEFWDGVYCLKCDFEDPKVGAPRAKVKDNDGYYAKVIDKNKEKRPKERKAE